MDPTAPQDAAPAAEETTPPPETEQPAADAAPEQPAEAAEGEAAAETDAAPEGGDDAPPAEGEPKHKRAGGWQRKIQKLEEAIQQRDALLARLLPTQPGAPAPGAPAAPGQPAKPKTADEAAAEFVASLVEKQLAEREAKRQQETATATFQQRYAAVRAEVEDFDDVIASASDIPVSAAVQQAILTSDVGPKIMYQLAKSPAELARICALPPLDAAREIGRLEARLASSTAAPSKPTPAPRKPAAPAPITPVTARGPTAIKNPAQMPYDEYRAWRDSQTKR